MRPIKIFPIKNVDDAENIAAAFNEVRTSGHVRLLFLSRDRVIYARGEFLSILKEICGVISDKTRGFDASLASKGGELSCQIIDLRCDAAEEKLVEEKKL